MTVLIELQRLNEKLLKTAYKYINITIIPFS